MEQEIIQPIDKELLKSELTPDKQLRLTNKSNNQIYVVTAHNAPNVLKEIGRLREIVFREAGGGTGKALDLDEFDVCDNCYKQLIVWNPEAEEIIGGYRYLLGTDWEYDKQGQPILATSHMFHFSERFIKEYAQKDGITYKGSTGRMSAYHFIFRTDFVYALLSAIICNMLHIASLM